MKADCKINMKELTGIVDGMLEEKNALGRQAFSIMTEDASQTSKIRDEIQASTGDIISTLDALEKIAAKGKVSKVYEMEKLVEDNVGPQLKKIQSLIVQHMDAVYNNNGVE